MASASLATTVSEPLAQDLRRDFGVRTEAVLNGYDDVALAELADRTPLSDARLNLLFVGNSLYGGRRSPVPLFDSAFRQRLGPRDIRFHFLGTDSQLVLKMAADAGVRDLVEVHPATSRTGSLAMQSRADALLLLMWNDPGEAGVYSGKIYEYIAVKRPIIYVGFPEGVAATLVDSRGLGWVVSSAASADAALSAALAVKPSSTLLPDLDPWRSEGLDRRTQTDRLVSMLEDAQRTHGRAVQ